MRRPFLSSAARALVLLFSFFLGGAPTPAMAKVPGPVALAVSPDGQRLYVTDLARKGIDVIDTVTDRLLTTLPASLSVLSPGLAVSPDGSRLYAIGASGLLIVSAADGKLQAQIQTGFLPSSVVESPDGSRVYVANEGSRTVSVVDTTSERVVATIPVGTGPVSLAITPDGKSVYVADLGFHPSPRTDDYVVVIDTATNRMKGMIAVAPWPFALAASPDGRRVYVTHTNSGSASVEVIDTARNQILHGDQAIPGGMSAGLAVSPDSKHLYLLPQPWNMVAAVDPNSGQAMGAAGVGQEPVGLAVSPDGKRLYVSSPTSQTVTVVDTTAFAALATIDLKPGSSGN